MIQILIGHRGVGKSTFLNRIRALTETPCFDLDEEIEKQHNQPIRRIFESGEREFRALETQALWNLVESARGPMIIAVGAGFEGPMPPEAKVIWLRRESDRHGRVFLNRPRLNSSVSLFDEYMERFPIREKRFHEWAHEELFLPEGGDGDLAQFVEHPEKFKVPFEITLLPENFRDWFYFLERRRDWNVRHFELRDDLLTPDQMEVAVDTLPPEQILFSRRKQDGPELPLKTDWALELGTPKAPPYILSLHERERDLSQTLKNFSTHKAEILKLAVKIDSFAELREGHRWWNEDPKRRAFLPRSEDGHWRWYRSLFGPRMPLHFISEGEGSAADQPKLWQCFLQTPFEKTFAAILGHPVSQSLTPIEQRAFFAEKKMPVVAVDIYESEFEQAIEVLRELGLTHAAVTAPLKLKAFAISTEKTPEAEEMQSVNTLLIKEAKIVGHNTDVLALEYIRDELPYFRSVWCWGGGGTLTSVKKAWPQVKLMSAREGRARDGSTDNPLPELLIWAAGRATAFWFPDVTPQLVLDLNYTADSPGLEFAAGRNLPYQSGLRMFKLQAESQREFWKGRQ
jgi:shikimate kinase